MKTIKTAISMPEDLYQAVRTRAGDKPFSTTMCDLIRQALGLEVIPTNTGITETSIYDQLRELTARIEAIEQRGVIPLQEQATGPGAAPGSITEVIPENEPVQPEVIPEIPAGPIPPPRVLAPDQVTLPMQPAPDRVTLTDEMKRRLAEKVKGALDAGSKYADISKSTGVSESQLKKMKSGRLGKDLRKSEYDAVMSLQSQNHSREGT